MGWTDLETQIAQWRSYLRRRQAVQTTDVEELEDHLRGQVATLTGAGLAEDEAFLVAVKRMGSLDTLSREFAREHSDRLWKQLVTDGDGAETSGPVARVETVVVVSLALLAALAVKVPAVFGWQIDGDDIGNYARNASFFVLPFLTGYFVWKRQLTWRDRVWLALPFVVAAVLVNVYPFAQGGATVLLSVLHLPIALWLVVGVAYTGGSWRSGLRRMDFVRFSGEWFIYFVLIACGGFVLIGITLGIFSSIGLEVEWVVGRWLVPCGAVGGVIVAAWLVEAKQSVIENMAPVLTRLFTPLFAVLLLVFLVTMAWTGSGINMERDVLIGFDLLLVVVLGLLLYTVSARDPQAPPDAFDALQWLLVVCALLVDLVALVAIAARISEFGWSANKVAALGENVVLLVNLGWSAWLLARFLRGRGSYAAVGDWQTTYLPVYAAWAGLIVVLFPPLFGYV